MCSFLSVCYIVAVAKVKIFSSLFVSSYLFKRNFQHEVTETSIILDAVCRHLYIFVTGESMLAYNLISGIRPNVKIELHYHDNRCMHDYHPGLNCHIYTWTHVFIWLSKDWYVKSSKSAKEEDSAHHTKFILLILIKAICSLSLLHKRVWNHRLSL